MQLAASGRDRGDLGSRRFARRILGCTSQPISDSHPDCLPSGPSAMRSPASPHASPNSPNLMWQADQIVRRARSSRGPCTAAHPPLALRSRMRSSYSMNSGGARPNRRRRSRPGERSSARTTQSHGPNGRRMRRTSGLHTPAPAPHACSCVTSVRWLRHRAGLACSRALRAIHEGDAG